VINGHVVEIGYNLLSWVDLVVDNLIVKNKITFKEFPFRPYTFLGLLESCKILLDNGSYIQEIRSKIRPFPKPLKKKIYDEFLPILLESSEELKDYSKRNIGILAYEFQLFRCLDALTQILYTVNDVYDAASKRSEHTLLHLRHLPSTLEPFLHTVLPRFYEKQDKVSAFMNQAIRFVREVAVV
jgi:hypothetical protein